MSAHKHMSIQSIVCPTFSLLPDLCLPSAVVQVVTMGLYLGQLKQ